MSRNTKSVEPPITIAEAAKILGVSQPTLRRWDELGKFPARRHPINRYRLYDRAKVMQLRDEILKGRRDSPRFFRWSITGAPR